MFLKAECSIATHLSLSILTEGGIQLMLASPICFSEKSYVSRSHASICLVWDVTLRRFQFQTCQLKRKLLTPHL